MPILQPSYDDIESAHHSRHDEARGLSAGPRETSRDLENAAIPIGDRMVDTGLFRLSTSGREELIRYIKKGDIPSWMGNYSARHSDNQSHTHYGSSQNQQIKENVLRGDACDEEEEEEDSTNRSGVLISPAEIERPRSALHSGDFREGVTKLHIPGLQTQSSTTCGNFSSSPTTPWYTPSLSSSLRGHKSLSYSREQLFSTGNRSRAPSLGSYSSSYVLKAPTSPLVYQANNTDLDFSPRTDVHSPSNSVDKASRRRTLPPETLPGLDSPRSGTINFGMPPRSSTYTLQLASSVQTSPSRTRRQSLVSDMSPKPHAPMVGSYEESILRGRMSMCPSKPLDFTAQIGVLGKGKCKANLKCPPHVTVAFPAVFYSYPTSGNGRSIADDSPSPYVGLIDLENSLPKDDSELNPRRRRHRNPTDASSDPFIDSCDQKTTYSSQEALRRREKKSRRTDSPKRPAGGCYRIPQQGQLQIVIKNPHKTAVKLFLVPYDLIDMEPGTKTFIRQRSYSAGPILDMPLTARKNLGTDRPEASLNATEDLRDKPVLRYLIHLNICCPSRGRFYLHSSIRVVFANRVPDGKERLRNEIQYPDPRYAPYKPSTGTKMSDRPYRRQAGEFCLSERLIPSASDSVRFSQYSSHLSTSTQDDASAGPFQPSASSSTIDERFLSTGSSVDHYRRESHEWAPMRSCRLPELPDTNLTSAEMYSKLSKGDVGYGGYPFMSVSSGSEAGESLLAQRLKGLGVQKKD
ncbi:hypothetical protein MPDQ_003847 [Monascus purpureus]|uniref:Atos-like conserved domain-containing protein n=1 Tax=Monascus purpureus TaxID=5098 RepID=A0A507R3H9_MONPU|nr:hypothetical protein MPDQ_003847 [Monascus purpureus]BDD59819.1 hypothetical protein MAP00_005006 [Monascus purpureus]